ncbi:MAG: hypothetical protein AAGK25_02050 [Pseudomonadota bacterium]
MNAHTPAQITGSTRARRGLFFRLFGYKPGSLAEMERFAHWAGTALLFIAIVTALTLSGFGEARIAVAATTLTPIFLISVSGAILWRVIRRRTARHATLRFQRAVYFLSYPVTLYAGIAGGFLLNVYTDKFLAVILLWQSMVGFALVTVTGRNALQYGVQITFALLPTLLLLLQTGEPRLSVLAILVYLGVCLATLIQLDMSDTSRRHRREILNIAGARDRSAAHLAQYLAATRDFIWSIDAGGRTARLPAPLFAEGSAPRTERANAMNSQPFDARALLARLNHPSRTALRRAFFARVPFRDLQIEMAMTDDQPRWYSVSGEPFYDHTGAFSGFRGVAIDISTAIHARKKINIYTERLESRVARRTQALDTALGEANTINQAQAHRAACHEVFFNALMDRLSLYTAEPIPSERIRNTASLLDIGRAVLALNSATPSTLESTHVPRERMTAPGDQLFYVDDMMRATMVAGQYQHLAGGVPMDIDRLCGEQVFGNPDHWSLALRLATYALLGNANTSVANPALCLTAGRADDGVVIAIKRHYESELDRLAPALHRQDQHFVQVDKAHPVEPARLIRSVTKTLLGDSKTSDPVSLAIPFARALVEEQGGQVRVADDGAIELLIPRVRLMGRLIA